ncbi:RNase H family protein [Thermosipho melanesiensis]|uniref:RNase H family protein n=1 Tax=Thermosipho melanesiensis TaxID=46541 RepID=UPI0000ED186E|nr:RNase H family protein [Thermosipho melanesiensis]
MISHQNHLLQLSGNKIKNRDFYGKVKLCERFLGNEKIFEILPYEFEVVGVKKARFQEICCLKNKNGHLKLQLFYNKTDKITSLVILKAENKEIVEKFVNYFKCLEIYVDGSYSHEFKRASFGVVILSKNIEKYYMVINKFLKHRNVTGEILGVIYALSYAYENGYGCVKLYYDYEGIEKWVVGEWKAKTELTKMYKEKVLEYGKYINIKFEKVRAHTGDKYNEQADKLAKYAIKTNSSNVEFEI